MPGDLIFDCGLDDFDRRVLAASREIPILVDFWADWCAPCHAVAPHLNRVINDLGGSLCLAKVEVDLGDNMKLAGRYRLRGFPTVMLFHHGEELTRFSGARPANWIRHWIEQHLGIEGS